MVTLMLPATALPPMATTTEMHLPPLKTTTITLSSAERFPAIAQKRQDLESSDQKIRE